MKDKKKIIIPVLVAVIVIIAVVIISRLTLRLDAERTSTVEVAVSYDGGAWETAASLAAQGSRRSYDLPFVPRRCGSLRLRLRGKGQITLRGLVRTIDPAKGKLWEEDTSWQA